jgi:hypothetical protein
VADQITNCTRCAKPLGKTQIWKKAKYCNEDCSNKYKQETRKKLAIYSKCELCGRDFIILASTQRFCSKKCGRKQYRRNGFAENGRERAKKFGVPYQFISWIKVLERDGYRCVICGRRTPAILRGTCDPRAPEVDHIIPVSKGGGHTYDNVQCTCRKCNAKKLARPLGQMRLYGGIPALNAFRFLNVS